MASDEELAAVVAATGDHRAFGELVRRHQSLVRGMLARMSRNSALADDLAQDAFIKAFEKIGSFSGSGSFKSWLCRIAYTEFLQSARRTRAQDRMLDRYKTGLEESEPARDSGASVDLDRGLATLREEERIAVVLCYACGLSHGEAAEATGMPLGTVKSHVNRGKAKLKTFFEAAEAVA